MARWYLLIITMSLSSGSATNADREGEIKIEKEVPGKG
jgi:hypothetical protein